MRSLPLYVWGIPSAQVQGLYSVLYETSILLSEPEPWICVRSTHINSLYLSHMDKGDK